MTENLPAKNHINLPSTEDILLETDDTEERVKKVDLAIANVGVQAVMLAWSQVEVTSLKQLHSLINATIKTCKHRRAILEMPYGSKNQSTQGRFVLPLD